MANEISTSPIPVRWLLLCKPLEPAFDMRFSTELDERSDLGETDPEELDERETTEAVVPDRSRAKSGASDVDIPLKDFVKKIFLSRKIKPRPGAVRCPGAVRRKIVEPEEISRWTSGPVPLSNILEEATNVENERVA